MHSIHTNRPLKLVAMAATATITAAMIAVGAPAASAADLIVQIPVKQNLFVAQNLGTINSGDKITWKNNDAHNVVSARIPAGVATFESPILAGPAATFALTPTVAGNYRYYCSLHSDAAAANAATQDPGEMVGQFTVGAAAPVVPPTTPPVVPPVTDPAVPPATDPAVPPATDPAVPPATGPVTPAATTLEISGGLASGFTPKTVHVTAGVATTITYKNTDSSPHDVTIPTLGGFKIFAEGGASASKVLTPTAAQVGSHPFICSLSGHSVLMNGTLIVDAPGTTPPPPVAGPAPAPVPAPAPAPEPVVPPAPGQPAAITVSGGLVSGFTPKTINVTAGVPTTITYKNTDTSPHDFTVATLDNFQLVAAGGASASKVLTPTAAQVGPHKYICSISGHAALMFGTLNVGAPGTTPPPPVAGPAPAPVPAPAPAPEPVVPPAPGQPAAITVSGGLVSGFTPKTINVTAGVATTITYKNTDASTPHDFTVATLDNFQIVAAGGASASKVLTPTAAQVGPHKFICSIPGHATLMFGTLNVDKAGTVQAGQAGTPVVAGAGQVSEIPSGGVASGGGSIAVSSNQSGLMTLGGGLFMVAFMSAVIARRRRVVLND